jgi:hypothetical protein
MKYCSIFEVGACLLLSLSSVLSFAIACGRLSPIPIRQAAVRFKMHRQDFNNCGITLVDITIDNGRWKGRLDEPPVGTLYAERRLIVDEGNHSYQARSDECEQHPGEYITWGPKNFETDYPEVKLITLNCSR